jgi:hypothetical protein
MAKKIEESEPKYTPSHETYPWLRLLDLDLQKVERGAPRGKGRPRNPFPRKAVHITLTDDELVALDEVVELLSSQMGPGIHRGNVVAFMAFQMRSALQQGDLAQFTSFSELAKVLERPKGGK